MRWALRGVIALILVCVAAELAARHYGFGRPLLYRPAQSGYEMVPDQHLERLGHTITVNRIGTRGPEVAARPAADTHRIIVLGDSVAYGGAMMNDDQTFPAVAQRRLAEQGRRAEIVNVSAGGWSLFDEVRWLHQHGLMGAETIVWTINHMDLDQGPNDSSQIGRNSAFPGHNPPFALWEVATRYVAPRLGLGRSGADAGSGDGATVDPVWEARVRQQVRQFVDQAARDHLRLMVLYHDGREPLTPARQAARDRLFAMLSQAGVPVTVTQVDRKTMFQDNIHPNAAGAEAIGGQVATMLRSAT